MYESIKDRVIEVANYMLKSKQTIREIAKKFHMSKSTIHKDISYRLRFIDYSLYEEVSKVVKEHKDIRHIRGGESTRIKYLQKRKGR